MEDLIIYLKILNKYLDINLNYSNNNLYIISGFIMKIFIYFFNELNI